MHIMLLGTDRNLFNTGSAVRSRIARFGEVYTDRLDSIVFSTRNLSIAGTQELAPHVYAHPTRSRSRFLYGLNAFLIARKLPRPDIVSAQDPFETGLAALCIAWYFKVPFAVEVHTDFLSPLFTRRSILNRARVLIARFVLARAAGGYTVSLSIRDAIQKRFPQASPLAVLPIYIDTRRFASVMHTQHPRFKTALLWVGRMEPEKDPLRALDACIAARKAGFDVGIIFVGDGSLSAALQEKVSLTDMTEYVVCTGFVRDVLPFYASADVLLVTSHFEGYGMVIVEALSAHVPVLSTDVGIAREAGAHIAEGDFSAALIALLRDMPQLSTLAIKQYADEQEYFEATRTLYAALAQQLGEGIH